jgi:TetR/AcrR family transcriptional repressor of nem operon
MGRTSDARERLMSAAHKLIWEFSYGAVTIDAICEQAGVKKGSFYYFFSSKSDLAVAAIDAWWVVRRALVEEVFRPEVPPLERIRNYLDFVSGLQIKSFEANKQVLGCPLFTLGSEICTQDERIRLRIQEILSVFADHVEQAIREAQATGELEGSNAELKGRFILSFYEGTLTRARIENDPEPIKRLSSDVLELLGARCALVAEPALALR